MALPHRARTRGLPGVASAPWTGVAAAFLFLTPAAAELIWDGNASRGTGAFKLIGSNCAAPGSVTAVNDPQFGTVWRYHKPAGSNRCESHGVKPGSTPFTFQNNATYYLGWRYKLSSTVNNNAQFQWKVFPSPGPADLNWPLALKVVNGRAVMLNRKAGNEVFEIWSSPIAANTWYHMVLALRLSNVRDGGYVEIWLDGKQQTLRGGGTRWACRLYDTEHVCPKWGVYGAEGREVINFVHGLKIGTTFADVYSGPPLALHPTQPGIPVLTVDRFFGPNSAPWLRDVLGRNRNAPPVLAPGLYFAPESGPGAIP